LAEDDGGIKELAASIERHGLISPLTVVPDGDKFRLLAGHRRFQALKTLFAGSAPCNVIEPNPELEDEVTIAENLIRLNLSAIEEAYAFALHLERTGGSHVELAQKLGKERTYVTRRLMLLDLDDVTLGALQDGLINLSQALLLRQVDSASIREKFIEHTVEYGANVRVMNIWVANYQKEQASIRAQEGREITPDEVHLSREVFMACDRCNDPTSYDILRPVYLCARCRQIIASHKATQLIEEDAQ
jgi:ParB/RepB/Spo0J family partition protein